MYAAMLNHTEIVKELVSAGAALDVQNKCGLTALTIAQEEGATEIIAHLEITTILEKASREQEEEAGCVCDGDADTYEGDTVQEREEGEGEKASSESKLSTTCKTKTKTKGGHTAVTWLLMEADVASRQNLYSTTVGILTLAAVLFSAAYKIMKHCKAQKRAWSAEDLMREARWEHAQQESSDDQVRQRRTAKAIAAARRAAEKTEREEREKSKKTAKKRNKGKLKKEAEQKKGEEEKEAKQQSHDERQRKKVELRRKWATLAGMAMRHHASEQRNTKQARQARRHARREAQRQEAAAARAVAAEAVTAMEDKASEFPNETGKSKSKATNATTTAHTAEDSECVYCMDAQKEAACVPCGHRGCMTCLTVTVDALTNGCPTCRATCREIIRLY
jgi:hypothetical protein